MKNRCDLNDITKPNDTVSRNVMRTLYNYSKINDRHRFISTGAWKMFACRFVPLIYTPH